jgi:hypothetical protein
MVKLTKDDILLIFASKDNRIKEFYELHYGKYEGEPTPATLQTISWDLIRKTDSWSQVFMQIHLNKMLMRMSKSKDYERSTGKRVGLLEIEPTLEEWIWYGISYFFMSITRDWLNEHAPDSWEKWVDEERDRFNKKMGFTNKFYTGNVVTYKGKKYYIKDIIHYNKDGEVVEHRDLNYLGCSSFDYVLGETSFYLKFDQDLDCIHNVKEEDLTLVSIRLDLNYFE